VNRPLFLLALAGCDTFGSIRATGRPVGEAYAAPHELRVLDVDSPLRAEKKVPVLSTPEVFAAYVPTRAEGDRMIGEHWIFFKLREAEWFIERLQDPDPPADGDAPPESMKELRELDWTRTVIPRRGETEARR
jgi:hypothetical protein